MRSKAEGVKYIRGIPGEILSVNGNGDLKIEVENTLTGQLEDYDLDRQLQSTYAKDNIMILTWSFFQ